MFCVDGDGPCRGEAWRFVPGLLRGRAAEAEAEGAGRGGDGDEGEADVAAGYGAEGGSALTSLQLLLELPRCTPRYPPPPSRGQRHVTSTTAARAEAKLGQASLPQEHSKQIVRPVFILITNNLLVFVY